MTLSTTSLFSASATTLPSATLHESAVVSLITNRLDLQVVEVRTLSHVLQAAGTALLSEGHFEQLTNLSLFLLLLLRKGQTYLTKCITWLALDLPTISHPFLLHTADLSAVHSLSTASRIARPPSWIITRRFIHSPTRLAESRNFTQEPYGLLLNLDLCVFSSPYSSPRNTA